MERIKTTLRLPVALHSRFDDSNMNADIVERLEQSFTNEWRGLNMSAQDLLQELALPDVVRLKPSTDNPHDDITRLCELITSLPVEAIMLSSNRARKLVAVIQLKDTTILADNLNFTLDSQGRAHDVRRLVGCLDVAGYLKTIKTSHQVAKETSQLPPNQALDVLCQSLLDEQGIKPLRSLFTLMNPAIDVEI